MIFGNAARFDRLLQGALVAAQGSADVKQKPKCTKSHTIAIPMLFLMQQLPLCLKKAILRFFGVAAQFGRLLRSLPVATNCAKLISNCVSTI